MKVLSLLLIVFTSVACSNLKVKKIEKVSGNTFPKNLSKTQVVEAIKAGGAQKGWGIRSSESENTLIGSLLVRQHKLEVTIPYTDQSYDIIYKSSEELNYSATDNTIHRNYFRWVINLRQAIDQQMALKANE